MTENVTIANCFVTGGYAVGSVLDGTWKPIGDVWGRSSGTGRIKLGTESNGGFRNIAITNCVFEACQGFALETEDGAVVEDITFTGVTMRNINSAPMFLRLGSRLRGPKPETVVGSLKRVIISNVTCSGSSQLPSILAGVPEHPVEDIKISDVYLHQVGGADAAMAALNPLENAEKYPDPRMFGDLPATGFYARHAKNIEFSNVEIATEHEDARPAFHMEDVDGVDFFRVKFPGRKTAGQFRLKDVTDFRVFGCKHYVDASTEHVDDELV
jgi:polygalacturonase